MQHQGNSAAAKPARQLTAANVPLTVSHRSPLGRPTGMQTRKTPEHPVVCHHVITSSEHPVVCHHQLVERFRNSQRVWAHLRVHVQHGADELPQTPVATIRLLAVPARWPSQAGPVMRCAAPPDRRKMHDNMHDNMHDKMRCTALAPLAVVTSAAALHGPCMPCVGEKRA
jgi:hypothetical protein